MVSARSSTTVSNFASGNALEISPATSADAEKSAESTPDLQTSTSSSERKSNSHKMGNHGNQCITLQLLPDWYPEVLLVLLVKADPVESEALAAEARGRGRGCQKGQVK